MKEECTSSVGRDRHMPCCEQIDFIKDPKGFAYGDDGEA